MNQYFYRCLLIFQNFITYIFINYFYFEFINLVCKYPNFILFNQLSNNKLESDFIFVSNKLFFGRIKLNISEFSPHNKNMLYKIKCRVMSHKTWLLKKKTALYLLIENNFLKNAIFDPWLN